MEFQIQLPKDKTTVFDNYVPIVRSNDGRVTNVYLTEAIGSPSQYNELCMLLLNAQEGDKYYFIINNPGGSSDTAFMIADAMDKSKATIHGIITGFVASAATIITMYCDTIEVAPYTSFMCHNYSHGAEGGGAQVKEYVNFTDKEFTRAAAEIYAGFLTEHELNDISTRDKEVWLNADEVIERWKNREEFLDKIPDIKIEQEE